MALLIKRNISVLGLELSELYVRLGYEVKPNGKEVLSNSLVFVSKDAYLESEENYINIPEIKKLKIFNYDRKKDGKDILTFVHNKWKDSLTEDITSNISSKDPLTGKKLYDPSTGIPITKTIISTYKFVEDSSILFVDIDKK